MAKIPTVAAVSHASSGPFCENLKCNDSDKKKDIDLEFAVFLDWPNGINIKITLY